MKVTVCCITYNHEPYIKDTLDGFLRQDFAEPWDIVISDDASTDGTASILKQYQEKYPDRIRLILNESNIGMMPNFIKVLKASNAEFTAVCEGDDYWTDPLKLRKQVDFLTGNPGYAFCAHRVMYQFGKKKRRSFHWDAPEDSDFRYLLRKGNYFSTLSIVYRNQQEVTDFLSRFPQAPLGDYLLYVASALHGKIRILDDVMGVYRVHKGGIWSQTGFEKVFDKLVQVVEMLLDALPEIHKDDLRIHLVRLIENRLWLDESFDPEGNSRLNALLSKLEIPIFVLDYIRFNNSERTRTSYYSKNVPASMLYGALKQKLTSRLRP